MPYRVLLVEDEEMIMRYNKRMIERASERFRVCHMAENGRDALEYLRDHPVDLLVTDVKMPVMDGIALVQEASRLYPRLLTLVISGYEDFHYVREFLRQGSEDYLLKPLKEETTRQQLQAIAEKLDTIHRAELRDAVAENLRSGTVEGPLREWYNSEGEHYSMVVLAAGYRSLHLLVSDYWLFC